MQESSQWKKWDLHIHTPESFFHNFKFIDNDERDKYSGKIWEKYIDKLEEVENISAIGITDYFTIDGYDKILDYREKGRLGNFDLILPNIELRLKAFSGSNSKRLNFHVIFSDKIDPSDIKENFLHNLYFEDRRGQEKSLTRRNIEKLGGELKKIDNKYQGNEFKVGCENLFIDLKKILNALNNESKFKENYLLVLSAKEWDEIGWFSQGRIIKDNSLFKSHAIFSSNAGTIDFCLGRKHNTTKEFLDEFDSFKPCIHGSDAHSFDKLCNPDEDRYCWIKALPTFEGLKQIIYEPEDRVKIQKESPEFYKNIYTLKNVDIFNSDISDEISINEQTLELDRNFVAITGGKGSGKTAILDLIANCYVDRCWNGGGDNGVEEDKNSFVQRIQKQGPDLGIKVGFVGASLEPFSKKLADRNFIEKSVITYLPQGKIEEISGNRAKLNDKIQEIIFNNEKIKEMQYKEKFIEIRDDVVKITDDIINCNTEISKIEKETTEKIISKLNGEKSIEEGKLEDIKTQIEKIEANFAEGIQEKISELKTQISANKENKSKISNIISELELLNGGIQNFIFSQNQTISSINKKLKEHGVELQIPRVDLGIQVDSLEKIKTLLEQKKEKSNEELGENEKSLIELSGEEAAHSKLLKDIDTINNEITRISEKLIEIDTKKDNIKILERDRETFYENLLIKFNEWKQYYEQVITTFSDGKNEILNDINFKSEILYDYNSFFKLAHEILNKKKVSSEEITSMARNVEDNITNYFYNESSFSDVIKSLNQFISKTEAIKSSHSNREFYDCIFGNYLSLTTDIEFREKSIDKLSMGQKGTVLLKLFLAEGDYPIILDQPEENLDNKFIYNELVSAMRNAKTKRQVIIATNNANLVVNTDAEQIIIAEFTDGKISYKSGALESPDVRQEIMPLLEGGQEAFKKREQKYGILGYNV